MSDKPSLKFDSLALHAGQAPDSDFRARGIPVYHTAAYLFRDSEHAAALFMHEEQGHFYGRVSNPTVETLEKRLTALEGGADAICTASGMAALTLTLLTLMDQGAHIVASNALYAGSYNLLAYTMPRFGVTTTFVDPRDPEAFRAAIRPETRLVLGEVIGNPGLEVMDIRSVADIAHEAGIPLMIDSTFATPYLCRPLELGADLVLHSVTKWLGGHGVAIGGAVIDGGVFDWAASPEKFPNLNTPIECQDNINFAEKFGRLAFTMRARSEAVRVFGACMAPETAFQLLLGVETLSLRMERHVANAKKVAEYLDERQRAGRGVKSVIYPGLDGAPDEKLVREILPRGAGAIVSFVVDGGKAASTRFVEGLKVFAHASNVGDAKSLAILPGLTTQSEMGADALDDAGIGPDWVRLSVGLEDAEDLIADLGQALDRAAA